MQKISGILAGSPRVLSIDMKDAPPVRPGTPGFGRPEGVSSQRDKGAAIDTARRAGEIQDGMAASRSKETEQAKLAARLSESFFASGRREEDSAEAGSEPGPGMALPVAIAEAPVPSRPAGFNHDAASVLREPALDPDSLYPKGSFLDTVA